MIPTALLGQIKSTDQPAVVFNARDKVQRLRTQQNAHSSARTGCIICGRSAADERDIANIQDILPERRCLIHAHDKADNQLKDLHVFRKLLGKTHARWGGYRS